ncbi:hypothetical protein ABFG93_15960 [Pseudalkalibacillus hwajinpoensis]|uniref:hypothetical protein n=1 Tax=Guptibacillus hwajinpoensis TaxID=208199 RepID=UPI00325A7574
MDFLKMVVVLSFLVMIANTIKPFVASLTRKRAVMFASFWLVLYILVWDVPSFLNTSSDGAKTSGEETVSGTEIDEDEVPVEEKQEEAKVEEEVTFDPASIEIIVNASELMGMEREEFKTNFPKAIDPDGESPTKMVFENGEVTFKDNKASSMTYYPEAMHYPEDNRLLLSSLGFDIEELRKGSNPFETPVTFYLIEGYSEVTIYGSEGPEEKKAIERIYIKKEFYPTPVTDEEEAEGEE